MTELQPGPRLPALTSHYSLGELLARYMWVRQIELTFGELRVSGSLEPDPAATDPADLRRGLLASFEAVLRLLDEVGVRHSQHPDFLLSGRVDHTLGGGQNFFMIEAAIELHLIPPRYT